MLTNLGLRNIAASTPWEAWRRLDEFGVIEHWHW
jgi:hypothetical protein